MRFSRQFAAGLADLLIDVLREIARRKYPGLPRRSAKTEDASPEDQEDDKQ